MKTKKTPPPESRLTLIKIMTVGSYSKGLYQCSCGELKILIVTTVNCGRVRSCGCLRRDLQGNRARRHGLFGHPLYSNWNNIIQRCYNTNDKDYHRYGGRGIKVCDEWRNSFLSFYNWAISQGWEKGMQIDKDIKGGNIYSPDNCTIVTNKTNSNHRRSSVLLTYNGKTQTMSEWAEEIKINYRSLKNRISVLGWSAERALTQSIRKSHDPHQR